MQTAAGTRPSQAVSAIQTCPAPDLPDIAQIVERQARLRRDQAEQGIQVGEGAPIATAISSHRNIAFTLI
jgi:hypothetical protein